MVNIKLLECILQEYAVAALSSAIQIKHITELDMSKVSVACTSVFIILFGLSW
jgi:hypothetical protein